MAGRRERTAGRVLRPVWCGPARPGAGDAVRGSPGAGTKSARCSGPGWRVPSGAGPSRRFPPLPSLLTCPVTPGAAEVPALLRWSDRPGSGPALRAVRPALKAPEGKWNRALALLHASVSLLALPSSSARDSPGPFSPDQFWSFQGVFTEQSVRLSCSTDGLLQGLNLNVRFSHCVEQVNGCVN